MDWQCVYRAWDRQWGSLSQDQQDAPTLHTFDSHPESVDRARKEFAELKLGEMVTDRQRFDNVSMDDAVFLDLINS